MVVEVDPFLSTLVCYGLPVVALAGLAALAVLLSRSRQNAARNRPQGVTLNPSRAEIRRRLADAYAAQVASGGLRKYLTSEQYRDYIASLAWKNRADQARRRVGYRCQLCNRKGELHVHHRTYERLGREMDEDLIVLCATCHKHFHSLGRRPMGGPTTR
jgi:5-methylcytosine-specific restriction endonuclease McrA